jgi:hypothetical protein
MSTFRPVNGNILVTKVDAEPFQRQTYIVYASDNKDFTVGEALVIKDDANIINLNSDLKLIKGEDVVAKEVE